MSVGHLDHVLLTVYSSMEHVTFEIWLSFIQRLLKMAPCDRSDHVRFPFLPLYSVLYHFRYIWRWRIWWSRLEF